MRAHALAGPFLPPRSRACQQPRRRASSALRSPACKRLPARSGPAPGRSPVAAMAAGRHAPHTVMPAVLWSDGQSGAVRPAGRRTASQASRTDRPGTDGSGRRNDDGPPPRIGSRRFWMAAAILVLVAAMVAGAWCLGCGRGVGLLGGVPEGGPLPAHLNPGSVILHQSPHSAPELNLDIPFSRTPLVPSV